MTHFNSSCFSVNIKCSECFDAKKMTMLWWREKEKRTTNNKRRWQRFACTYNVVQCKIYTYNTYVEPRAQWKCIYVSHHLMSIFRKSDIVSHFTPNDSCILHIVQMKMSDEQNQNSISCNGKTIISYFVYFCWIWWLNHQSLWCKGAKILKNKNKVNTQTQAIMVQWMVNSYRTECDKLLTNSIIFFRIHNINFAKSLSLHRFGMYNACTPTHAHMIFKSHLHTLAQQSYNDNNSYCAWVYLVFRLHTPIGLLLFASFFHIQNGTKVKKYANEWTEWRMKCVKNYVWIIMS